MKAIYFFDDVMVERRPALERVWGKPSFVKPVFPEPVPGALGCRPNNVHFSEADGRYVMYVAVNPVDEDADIFTIRLTSEDPCTWPEPKPASGPTSAWDGLADFVVDETGDRRKGLVSSLAGTPLQERGCILTTVDEENDRSLVGFSSDGIHFELDRQHPWRHVRSDTWNGVLWNPVARHYQIFTRPLYGDRKIAFVTTRDFQSFSECVTILQPDSFDGLGTELYGMPCTRYEDLFVGSLHSGHHLGGEHLALDTGHPQCTLQRLCQTADTLRNHCLHPGWQRFPI